MKTKVQIPFQLRRDRPHAALASAVVLRAAKDVQNTSSMKPDQRRGRGPAVKLSRLRAWIQWSILPERLVIRDLVDGGDVLDAPDVPNDVEVRATEAARLVRKEGLTQAEAGEELGVSQQTVSRYLNEVKPQSYA